MINLLPSEEKEFLRLELKKRIVAIIWFLFLFFLLCFILILFSIKFYLSGEIDSEKIIIERTQDKEKQAEFEDIQKKLNSFNNVLVKMDNFYSRRVNFSEVFNRISGLLPENSYLKSVSLNSLENREIQVSLSGFISDRESLFDFKKTVEKEKGIKLEANSFPASNWIKPTDINFSAIFKISK